MALIIVSAIRQKNVRQKNRRLHFSVLHFSVWLVSVAETTNEKGDECGGLGFSGDQKDGAASAGTLLAFERFRQDQTIGIQYSESNQSCPISGFD
jgi:hypothetical protein